MKFKNKTHEQAYNRFINSARVNDDVERQSLFYLLSLFPETIINIGSLYDFEDNHIKFDGFNESWQTSGTLSCCRLAFNLYNGFNGLEDEEYKYTVLNIFAYVDDENKEYFLEAIKIRFKMR